MYKNAFFLQGFYTVYDTVFKTISGEDIEYMDDPDFSAPDFGNSQSSYEEVYVCLIKNFP